MTAASPLAFTFTVRTSTQVRSATVRLLAIFVQLVGTYWSSKAQGSYGAYRLRLGNGTVYPGTNSYGKYYGFSVRCLAGG